MASPTPSLTFTYAEPLFYFSLAGRFLARSFSFLGWLSFAFLAILLITSGVERLRFLGFFLALITVSRLMYLRGPDSKIAPAQLPPSGSLELSSFLAASTRRTLLAALDRASLAGHKDLFPGFLLARLLASSSVRDVLRRAEFEAGSSDAVLKSPAAATKLAPLECARQLLAAALGEAILSNQSAIYPPHLLIALAQFPNPAIAQFFEQHHLSVATLRSALLLSAVHSRLPRRHLAFRRFLPSERRLPHHVMNRAWTARPTPFLDRFAQDLTDRARIGDIGFLVNREKEFETLLSVLSRGRRTNALLVGEEGVGREVLVEHLAWRVWRDEVPSELFDRRVVKLDFGALGAGTRSAGELQERMSRVVTEIISAGNIILYIPDIHNLVEGMEGVSAAEILKPILDSAILPIIGSTTPDAYARLIEKRSDFGAAFEVIRIPELSTEDATHYLTLAATLLEAREGVKVSAYAVVRAVELASQLLRDKPLPRSAEDLLSEVVSAKRRDKTRWVFTRDIEAVVTKRTGVPTTVARAEEARRLLNLEDELHKRIVDQEEGVRAISSALREYRAGITPTTRPIANFLFVGPTGVGKTETAKALSELYFGGEAKMIRLDMSEYQTKDALSRFIGSREQGTKGTLTEAAKRQPYALLLLDEFEKANPDILNLFLQVFDDGRLTDAFGTTVDFTHTIIIATSNAHSAFVKSEIERGRPINEIEEELKKKLVDYFKPELLNRFDRIVMFRPLSPEDLKKIVDIQLRQLRELLAERHGIEVGFAPEVREELVKLGYSPVYGARPLRYVIREKLRSPLAEAILRGEFGRGSKVQAVFEDSTFRVQKM